MGRAYEVRKASIQKTGAAKAKLYSMYAREIYDAAKKGGTDPIGNASLRRLIEKAKKDQVPGDIIKRAIDKVSSGVDESYEHARYEMFGPAGSTLIVDCLTDNVNRTISSIRTALNKCKSKMGVTGSVSFNYDNNTVIGFKGMSEEETIDALIEGGVDVEDIEQNDDVVVIYGNPTDFNAIHEAISAKLPNVSFEIDEISAWLPKETITLSGDDLELFERLTTMLDEIEDVQNVFHNVA